MAVRNRRARCEHCPCTPTSYSLILFFTHIKFSLLPHHNSKVEDTKDHTEEVGNSLLLQGKRYTPKQLATSLPDGVASIRKVTSNTRQRDERFAHDENQENVVEALDKQRRTMIPLADLVETAKTRNTENERWVHPDVAEVLVDVKDVPTKKFWEDMPMVSTPDKCKGFHVAAALEKHVPSLWKPSMTAFKKKELVNAVHGHVLKAAQTIDTDENPAAFKLQWQSVIDLKVLEITDIQRGDRIVSTNWALDMMEALDKEPDIKHSIKDRELGERALIDLASTATGFNYEDFPCECQGDREAAVYEMIHGTEGYSALLNRQVQNKFEGCEEPFNGKVVTIEHDEESKLTWFTVQWSDGDKEDGHYLEVRDWVLPETH